MDIYDQYIYDEKRLAFDVLNKTLQFLIINKEVKSVPNRK